MLMIVINTGCPSSPSTISHGGDSTQGSPPQQLKSSSSSLGDSTQGSPPKKKTRYQKTYSKDSTQGSPPKQ
jgi:hypothetical protein